jgi:hypothetical protein
MAVLLGFWPFFSCTSTAIRYSSPENRYSDLEIRYSDLEIRYSDPENRYSDPEIWYSGTGIWYSKTGVLSTKMAVLFTKSPNLCSKTRIPNRGNGGFPKENEDLVREDGPGFAPARNVLAAATRLLPAAQPITMRCMDSGRLAATRETTLPLSKLTSVARRLPPKTTVSTPNVAAISIMVSAGESLTL